MKPAAFDYVDPATVAEVVQVLASHGDDAKILAGGQSLLPLMNLRLAAPAVLVDLRRVPGLSGISTENDQVVMGAMTRHAEALSSPTTNQHLPVLAEALRWVGHTAIRNAGTIGGSIAHADPAAELPLILSLLDGEVVLEGASGRRTVPAGELFLGYFTTAIDEGEVLTEIRWPVLHHSGWGFHEVARRHGDFCMASAGAILELDDNLRIVDARIAVGGVADRAVRMHHVETSLTGSDATNEVLDAAAESVAADLHPHDDLHASSAYRRNLAKVLTRRALADALDRSRRG